MLSELSVALLGALSLSSTFVTAAPAPTLEKRVALGTPTDGCRVGQLRLAGACVDINTCLFASVSSLLKVSLDIGSLGLLKLDTGKVLDLTTNTCISVNQCLAVKSSTVVTQTVAGILGVKVCQRPTCSGLTVLNLNTGICECPLDHVWSGSDKKVCIKRSSCNTLVNSILDGVCLPKVCLGATVLLTSASDKSLAVHVGTCIDLSLCQRIGVHDSKKNACKQKSCSKGQILNVDSGACECPTSRGYLLSGINADICIKTSACSTKTNTIVGNLCVPKVCAAGQVLLGSATEKSLLARVGLCIDLGTCNLIGSVDSKTGICHQKKCSSDKILNVDNGLCVCATGRLLNSATNLCINVDTCNSLLNDIVDGLCKPKTCSGPLVLNSSGLWVCPVGRVLSKVSNSCININLCLSHSNGVCNLLAGVGAGLGATVHNLAGAGAKVGAIVNHLLDAAVEVKVSA